MAENKLVTEVARLMERLDESLFGYLLGSMTPESACKLAVLSTNFRDWVNRSPFWETWCERDSPSLTTPIAKELLKQHYGARQSRSYKDLFQRLSIKRCARLRPSCECQINGEGLFDFIMLVDVFLDDEGVLFCSVESSELGKELQACRKDDCQDYEEECGSVLKGAHKSARQGEVCSTILQRIAEYEWTYRSGGTRAWPEVTESPAQERRKRNVITFSWKLMRKTDGKVQILLDRVFPRFGYDTMMFGPSEFYLMESRVLKDVDAEDFVFCEADMYLGCNDGDQRLLKCMQADTKVPETSMLHGFSVHVGLSEARLNESRLKHDIVRSMLKNVLRRWL